MFLTCLYWNVPGHVQDTSPPMSPFFVSYIYLFFFFVSKFRKFKHLRKTIRIQEWNTVIFSHVAISQNAATWAPRQEDWSTGIQNAEHFIPAFFRKTISLYYYGPNVLIHCYNIQYTEQLVPQIITFTTFQAQELPELKAIENKLPRKCV